MTSDFELNLEKFANVVVRAGLNLQPGQRLLIMGVPQLGHHGALLELAPLIRWITAKAYGAGASLVDVLWSDDQLRVIRFQEASRDSFGEYPNWRVDVASEFSTAGDAVLVVYAENPALLIDQDANLIAEARRTNFAHARPFEDLRRKNATNCTVITAPVEGWADVVFADLPPEHRMAQLWETIFEIYRIQQSDPVSAWNDHINELIARRDYLNQKRYTAVRLTAPGTDLTIGLPTEHLWVSARLTSQTGIDYMANIPTEEIFTGPHRANVNGLVSSTKPLNLGGAWIEDFTLTFKEGRVVNATAKKGEQSLRTMLDTDEGASRLGEVALVPHSSPISMSGLVFCNALLDENAASHLALGQAMRFNMKDGETMSDDEFSSSGANLSGIHVDFMVGSERMDVDGITADGDCEALMRNGEWAFEA